jgi:hypothetical protein
MDRHTILSVLSLMISYLFATDMTCRFKLLLKRYKPKRLVVERGASWLSTFRNLTTWRAFPVSVVRAVRRDSHFCNGYVDAEEASPIMDLLDATH